MCVCVCVCVYVCVTMTILTILHCTNAIPSVGGRSYHCSGKSDGAPSMVFMLRTLYYVLIQTYFMQSVLHIPNKLDAPNKLHDIITGSQVLFQVKHNRLLSPLQSHGSALPWATACCPMGSLDHIKMPITSIASCQEHHLMNYHQYIKILRVCVCVCVCVCE